MGDGPFELHMVGVSEAVEAALEPLLEAGKESDGLLPFRALSSRPMVLSQNVLGHGRDQRAGQDEGREHGEDDGLRHRHEEPAGHAGQLEQRKPDDGDAERGDKRRDHDLIGGVDDGRLQRLAHGQVGVDILDHDGRVIHENADRQGQPPQGHEIHRLADRMQADDGGEDRERDRRRDDDRGPPGAEKQQHDEPGQGGGSHHLLHHIQDRLVHEDRGVVQDLDLHAGRDDLFNPWERVLDPVHHVQGRGFAALHDDDHDGLLAVDQHGVGLRWAGQAHVGDVAHINVRVVLPLDGDAVEVLDL